MYLLQIQSIGKTKKNHKIVYSVWEWPILIFFFFFKEYSIISKWCDSREKILLNFQK